MNISRFLLLALSTIIFQTTSFVHAMEQATTPFASDEKEQVFSSIAVTAMLDKQCEEKQEELLTNIQKNPDYDLNSFINGISKEITKYFNECKETIDAYQNDTLEDEDEYTQIPEDIRVLVAPENALTILIASCDSKNALTIKSLYDFVAGQHNAASRANIKGQLLARIAQIQFALPEHYENLLKPDITEKEATNIVNSNRDFIKLILIMQTLFPEISSNDFIRDSNGNTPLHYAAQHNPALLLLCAIHRNRPITQNNLRITNEHNKTVLNLAEDNKRAEAITILTAVAPREDVQGTTPAAS